MSILLDAAGWRRSPATVPGYRAGCSPRNKGQLCPADPLRVEAPPRRAIGPPNRPFGDDHIGAIVTTCVKSVSAT